jgi:hypothetical protein
MVRVALLALVGCVQGGGRSHCNLVCTDYVALLAHVTAAPAELSGDKMTLCMNNVCDFQMLPFSTFDAYWGSWRVTIEAAAAGGSDIRLDANALQLPLVDGDLYRMTITTPTSATAFDGTGSATYTTVPQPCGPGTCTQGGVTLQ